MELSGLSWSSAKGTIPMSVSMGCPIVPRFFAHREQSSLQPEDISYDRLMRRAGSWSRSSLFNSSDSDHGSQTMLTMLWRYGWLLMYSNPINQVRKSNEMSVVEGL